MNYLLDSNVLLLLLVGMTNPRWIEQHKGTRSRFTSKHFRKLLFHLGEPIKLSTTSNVLTEVSNLASQIGETRIDPRRMHLRATLGRLIETTLEVHLPGKLVTKDPYLLRLGLTDALILRLKPQEHRILSTDAELCLACHEVGLPCTNLTPVLFEEA